MMGSLAIRGIGVVGGGPKYYMHVKHSGEGAELDVVRGWLQEEKVVYSRIIIGLQIKKRRKKTELTKWNTCG